MLRMMQCPQCGAENSAKRSACFQCQADLHPAAEAPRPQPAVLVPHAELPRTAPAAGATPRPSPREAKASRPPSTPWSDEAGVLAWLLFPNAAGKARLFRQVEQQLRAGISIGEAFHYLSLEGSARFRRPCASIAAELFQGGPLSQAAQPFHNLFALEDLGLLRVGELSGNLAEVFAQMAQRLEQLVELRWGFIISNWHLFIFYVPGLLLLLPVALTVNDPTVFDVNRLSKGTPNENLMLIVHESLRHALTTSLPIVAGGIGLIVGWRLLGSGRSGQQIKHRILLAIPLVGGAFRRAAVGRFIGNLSALWGGGAPPSMAVEAAAEASGNAVLAARIKAIIPDLQAGTPLASALASTGIFDAEALGVMRTGELTGELPASLDRLARDMHLNTRLAFRRLPFLTYLVLYGLIAFVSIKLIFSMYMAYYGRFIGQMAEPDFGF